MRRIPIFLLAITALLVGCPDERDSFELQSWEVWWEQEPGRIFHDADTNGPHTYLVGERGGRGHVFFPDGSEWRSISFAPMEVGPLFAVHVFENGALALGGTDGFIAVGNPSAWEVFEAPIPQDVVQLWGATPSELWAVSANGRIMRFHNGEWTVIEYWQHGLTGARVNSVDGTAPDDVWFAGEDGLVIQWNGQKLIGSYPGEGSGEAILARPDRIFVEEYQLDRTSEVAEWVRDSNSYKAVFFDEFDEQVWSVARYYGPRVIWDGSSEWDRPSAPSDPALPAIEFVFPANDEIAVASEFEVFRQVE